MFNFKKHSVMTSLAIAFFILAVFIFGFVSGWLVRASQEAKAELGVVTEDSTFMLELDSRVKSWESDFLEEQREFYERQPEIPDCLARPMPDYYLDNDYELRSAREPERRRSPN